VLRSFCGADFYSEEALTAGNTLCIVKGNNDLWAKICPHKTGTDSASVGPRRLLRKSKNQHPVGVLVFGTP